jgi:hippurate hydrolase
VQLLAIKLGDDKIFQTSQWTAAEDFSNYGRTKEKVPSLMLWVGSEKKETMDKISKGIKTPILHSADFNPDYERTIKTGVFTITESAYELLSGN